jgi:hypothetical protein
MSVAPGSPRRAGHVRKDSDSISLSVDVPIESLTWKHDDRELNEYMVKVAVIDEREQTAKAAAAGGQHSNKSSLGSFGEVEQLLEEEERVKKVPVYSSAAEGELPEVTPEAIQKTLLTTTGKEDVKDEVEGVKKEKFWSPPFSCEANAKLPGPYPFEQEGFEYPPEIAVSQELEAAVLAGAAAVAAPVVVLAAAPVEEVAIAPVVAAPVENEVSAAVARKEAVVSDKESESAVQKVAEVAAPVAVAAAVAAVIVSDEEVKEVVVEEVQVKEPVAEITVKDVAEDVESKESVKVVSEAFICDENAKLPGPYPVKPKFKSGPFSCDENAKLPGPYPTEASVVVAHEQEVKELEVSAPEVAVAAAAVASTVVAAQVIEEKEAQESVKMTSEAFNCDENAKLPGPYPVKPKFKSGPFSCEENAKLPGPYPVSVEEYKEAPAVVKVVTDDYNSQEEPFNSGLSDTPQVLTSDPESPKPAVVVKSSAAKPAAAPAPVVDSSRKVSFKPEPLEEKKSLPSASSAPQPASAEENLPWFAKSFGRRRSANDAEAQANPPPMERKSSIFGTTKDGKPRRIRPVKNLKKMFAAGKNSN